MSTDWVLPDYGGRTLSNILPSIQARLLGLTPIIALPEARRYVVLLVDGLGWHPLNDHLDHAETMADLLAGSSPLTCGIPSTTATSLTSLGCGRAPGAHGIVGYTFLDPDADRVVNALSWEGGPEDVEGFRRVETLFQQLGRQGLGSAVVNLPRFSDTALTRLAFSGASQQALEAESDPQAFCTAIADALADHRVVYCYERMLDHVGHGHGVGSWQWLDELARIDDLVHELGRVLPDDTCVIITGDHGMVNVPAEHRITAEDHRELAGFRHIAGEGRLRQLFTSQPARLADAWSSHLGQRATVQLRDDAVAAGWFGDSLNPGVAERLGDVLVAMHDDWAVMSRTFPGEFNLVGMHGSLTAAEMLVPLLVMGPT